MLIKSKLYAVLLILTCVSCIIDSSKAKKIVVNEDVNIKKEKDSLTIHKIDSIILNESNIIGEIIIKEVSSSKGYIEYYLDKEGFILKIKITYYGYSGKAIWSYYLTDNTLFYVSNKTFRYIDPSSNNGEVKSIKESRYYMSNNKLIRWIGEDMIVIDSMSKIFKEEEKNLLKDIKGFRDMLK